MCTHNQCLSINKKKYHNFSFENYHFTAVNYCRILHGCVCVMYLFLVTHPIRESFEYHCHSFQRWYFLSDL